MLHGPKHAWGREWVTNERYWLALFAPLCHASFPAKGGRVNDVRVVEVVVGDLTDRGTPIRLDPD